MRLRYSLLSEIGYVWILPVSLYEYPSFCIRKTMPIFPFHFRCRDIFSWSGNIFSFSSSWTWKTTANFLWKCHRKQQTHLWLVHSEASFVFFVLLGSMTRKIWVCQCFYRAFDSHLIQNLAALSRCFFQPTLVHVSLSQYERVFKDTEICKQKPNLRAAFIPRKASAPIAWALRFLILLISC